MQEQHQRRGPSPQQVIADQKRMAEAHKAAQVQQRKQQAVVPAATAVLPAVPDNRDYVSRYLDEEAGTTIAGKLLKFSKGRYVAKDDDTEMPLDTAFTVLCHETVVGWLRFTDGGPPLRHMGLLFDDPPYVMVPRETLGDLDESRWEIGLDGRPSDPWLHVQYLVLQHAETGQLYTFSAMTGTARTAVSRLLQHYKRRVKTNPDELPVVALKKSGFHPRSAPNLWVEVPVFAIIGKTIRDAVAKPDVSVAADMDDSIGF